MGTIPNDWARLFKLLGELGAASRLRVCYEAGPTGYGLARRLNEAGICCVVIAPSLIPLQSGRRVKTDRRDAQKLAELLRAGLLTEVQIPEAETEAMRDLERARDDAKNAERTARHQLDKFLLRQGRIWSRSKWTRLHWSWIKEQAFPAEGLRRVHLDYQRAVEEATARVERLEKDLEELVEKWELRPLVEALQALRGVRLITAVILAAEVGNFLRFQTARQLMSYLGQAVVKELSAAKTSVLVQAYSFTSTPNAGERSLRHAVIWRKLSFGTQSASGSRFSDARCERALEQLAVFPKPRLNRFLY